LRLEPGSPKSQEGGLLFLTPELRADLADQLARVKALEQEMSTIIPRLFSHLHGVIRGTASNPFARLGRRHAVRQDV
jgi:hypothetical protein